MGLIEVDKATYLKIEIEILNLKYGQYKSHGNRERTTIVVMEGSITRVRRNGTTKYFVSPYFLTNKS